MPTGRLLPLAGHGSLQTLFWNSPQNKVQLANNHFRFQLL